MQSLVSATSLILLCLALAHLQELDASAKTVGSPAAQIVSLQVMEAVVSEFSLVTASALGLSWEFHENCRNQLEEQFLRQIFEHAVHSAQQAASQVRTAAPGSEAAAGAASSATAAMKLMAAVLAWDFKATNSSFVSATAAITAAMSGRKGLPDTTQVKPGAHWADILLTAATTDWVITLMPALQGPAAASQLATAARQLVVAFCCLAGDVFPKPTVTSAVAAAGGAANAACAAPVAVTHVVQMLRLVLPWCMPAQQVLKQALAGDEGQLVDACRALAALCAGHKVGVLEAASSAVAGQQQGSIFTALESLTCSFLAAGGVSAASSTEPWLPDCTEMLLECWSGLLAPQCGYAMTAVPPPAQAVECATRTAAAVVEAALKDAAAGAHEDADDDEDSGAGAVHQEEWMARVAVLLRAHPVASFNQLADLIGSKQQALAAAAAARQDPSELLEQLYWLVRMAAHALADSGIGEIPLPPEAVLLAVGDSSLTAPGAVTSPEQQQASAASASAGAAAVERLSRSLLELTAVCLQQAAAAVVSSRLMEGSTWAAARWADTYLFPEEEEPLPEALEAAFGDQSGLNILDMLVHVAQRCLVAFPGEIELHRQVCHTLLPTLVHRKPLCRRLITLSSWQALAAAFARRDVHLTRHLSQKFQRALSRCLCLAASGFPDAASPQQYVTGLMAETVKEAMELPRQSPQQLAAVAQRADVQLQVCCGLEVLRGAAAGTLPSTFPALLNMFNSLLNPLLTLHAAFKHVAPVVALLLKLADDIVENLSVYMEGVQQKEQLLNWTLQLLVQYRDSNLWQVSLQTAKSLKEDRAAEQCRDLRAVLNLLIHITQSDLSAEEEDNMRPLGGIAFVAPLAAPGDSAAAAVAPEGTSVIARVVLVGLNIVLPLINAELLKFPKLAQLYYSLLSYMLEVYPRAVADLEPSHFGSLMATLEWGLLGNDVVAVHCSLEGLAGLAKYQYESVQTGGRGLAGQSAGNRSVVSHFQELLLRRLLLEDTPQDMVELAADALLPLLLAEPANFGPLSTAVAAAAGVNGDPRASAAVANALSQLGSWLQTHSEQLAAGPANGDAGSTMLRTAARQFRQRLSQMVADIRGLIRLR
eukprot:GHUV01026164.1.p1 GENE.GHUV01026164.1~~GHUV01026164.1.p1  ORF type:complete len:1105 (+),score=386.39 GHUV01026164.1:1431-4745(+)